MRNTLKKRVFYGLAAAVVSISFASCEISEVAIETESIAQNEGISVGTIDTSLVNSTDLDCDVICEGSYDETTHTYINEFTGFQCKFTDGWEVVCGSRAVNDEYMDMYATYDDILSLYIIRYDYAVNFDDLLEWTDSVVDDDLFLDKDMRWYAARFLNIDRYTIKIGSCDFLGTRMKSCDYSNDMTKIYTKSVFTSQGQYRYQIIAISLDENKTDELLGMFEPYKNGFSQKTEGDNCERRN